MRYKAAFTAPVISLRENRAKLTQRDVRAVNNFIPSKSARIVLARKRIEMQTARSVIRIYQERANILFEYLEQSGLAQQWIDDSVRLYTALHKPGESVTQTQRAIKQELKVDTSVMENIGARLLDANKDARIEMKRIEAPLYIGTVLLAEDGALWGRQQIQMLNKQNGNVTTQQFSKAAGPATFTAEDTMLGSLAFELGSEPRLLDAFQARGNEIKLSGFTNGMFDTLQGTLQKDLFEKGNGMREQAQALWESLATKYKSKLPVEASQRIELWVRTEGCVVQNDSLMAIGKESGMDGKRWDSVGDGLVRPAHQSNTAAGIIAVKDNFPDGSRDAGGGSVSPYNCFHPSQIIQGDYIAASRVHYSGRMYVVEFGEGHSICCTANHPILTSKGFKFACALRNGDQLVCGPLHVVNWDCINTRQHDVANKESTIENVFQTLAKGNIQRTGFRDVTPLDLYNDGEFCEGNIDVVFADARLCADIYMRRFEQLYHGVFTDAAQRIVRALHLLSNFRGRLLDVAPLNQFLFACSAQCNISQFQLGIDDITVARKMFSDCFNTHLLLDIHRTNFSRHYMFEFASAFVFGGVNPMFAERAVYSFGTSMRLLRKLSRRYATRVCFNKVISVNHFEYSGYVYDVESTTGLMITQGGAICKQCRCATAGALLKKAYKVPDKPTKITVIKDPADASKIKPTAVETKPAKVAKPKNVAPKELQIPKPTTSKSIDAASLDERIAAYAKTVSDDAAAEATFRSILQREATHIDTGGVPVANIYSLSDVNDAYRAYSATGFQEVNAVLRGETLTDFQTQKFLTNYQITVKDTLKTLQDDIAAAVGTPDDLILYRGLVSSRQEALLARIESQGMDALIGQTYTESQFISTSLRKQTAEGFMYENQSVLLEILTPKGTRVLPMNVAEKELVFAPNTPFKIERVQRITKPTMPNSNIPSYKITLTPQSEVIQSVAVAPKPVVVAAPVPKPVPKNVPPKIMQAPKLTLKPSVVNEIPVLEGEALDATYLKMLNNELRLHGKDTYIADNIANSVSLHGTGDTAYHAIGGRYSHYEAVNTYLRTGKLPIGFDREAFTFKYNLTIDEVIARLKSDIAMSVGLEKDTLLYRGVAEDYAKKFFSSSNHPDTLIGTIIHDDAFMATTLKRTHADEFLASAKDAQSVLFEIHAPAGLRGIPMAAEEYEFLLASGTDLEIFGAELTQNRLLLKVRPVNAPRAVGINLPPVTPPVLATNETLVADLVNAYRVGNESPSISFANLNDWARGQRGLPSGNDIARTLIDDVPAYKAYGTTGYTPMQTAMRNGIDAVSPADQATFLQTFGISITEANKIILQDLASSATSPSMMRNSILYRSVGGDFAKRVQALVNTGKLDTLVGTVYKDSQFMSTTLSRDIALDYVKTGVAAGDAPVVLEILASQGTRVLPLNAQQFEVLLSADSQFIIQRAYTQNGINYITLGKSTIV